MQPAGGAALTQGLAPSPSHFAPMHSISFQPAASTASIFFASLPQMHARHAIGVIGVSFMLFITHISGVIIPPIEPPDPAVEPPDPAVEPPDPALVPADPALPAEPPLP